MQVATESFYQTIINIWCKTSGGT